MKERIFLLFLFLLFLGSISFGVVLFENNEELKEQLEDRDRLLNDARVRDSLYTLQTKSYSDTITKYVSNCEFEIDGKTITTADLVKMFNQIAQEKVDAMDSVFVEKQRVANMMELMNKYRGLTQDCIKERNNLLDSTRIYHTMLELIKDRYGIEMKVDQTGERSYKYYRGEFSKADSGLLLLPYFRDKLKREAGSNNWIISRN